MKAFLGAKVVLTAMILATVAANSLEAQTFTSSPNVAIPDSPAAGVSDTINVTGVTGAITSLRVDVRIDHTWDSDLDIWLIPPGTNWSGPYRNGAPPAGVIDLSTDNGGSGDNYGSGAGPITYAQFSSSTDPTTPGTVTVVGAAAPFTAGVYIPEGTAAFDALYNTISPNGAWTLGIGDDTGSDTGTLISWQIVVVGGAAGQPEIAVTRGSNGVADGGTDAVGTLVTGSATSLTYTIDNLGLQDLTLTTPFAAPGGLTNCTASISTQPTSPVTGGNSTTLVVDVTPTTATTWSCTITFANNDPDENPFDFTISGDANSPALAIADSSPGAAIVFRPTTDRVVAAFTATSAAGGQTISGVDVAKTGTLVDGEISAVKLWRDVNNNGVLDSGTDTQAGSTQTFASGTASFTGLSEVVTNPTVGNFLITFSLPANATIGNTMGCDVTAVTATPGAVSGTPTTGPVHTVGGSVSALPFMDDFEPATVITNRAIQITGNFPSGTTTPLGSTTFGADAQVQVGITTGTTSPLGTQHAMIDFPNGDACGAIDYAFDLSAYNANSNTLVLSFDYAENGDESDAEDGVYLSLDGGATWVLNLNVLANGSATYTTRTVDVSAALVGASLNYTNQVIIRFQGQDNSSNPGGDGHFFDNIQLFEPNEMDVLRGATGVAVSATDNVDIVSAGSNITYTIENNGGSPLNLTGASPFVVVTGVTNINTVTVTGIPTTPIAAGGNTTFTINVVPTTASVSGDAYSFTVSIANDDSDENPYDFTVSGNAFTNVPPAVSVPGTGSNWVDAGGGLFTLTLAPGATIADALTVTDATPDPMTVTVTNPATALTTLTAQPVTNATATAGPIRLAWAGTADGSNAPGVNFDWSIDINDGVSSTVITARIIITDVAPTSTILNASGGDGSSGTPYTGSFVVGDTGATSIDLATVTDGNTGQTVALNGTPSQTSGPTGGTGFQFTLSAGILTVAPAGALVAADAGVQVFDVVVTDGGANTSTTFSVSLTVSDVSTVMAFTNTSPLAGGTVGTVYGPVTMAVTGATGTVAFSIVNNTSLPAGLTLNGSTGEITGTPTVAGTVTFDVRALDTTANEALTGTFEITINAAGGSSGGGGGGDDGGCVATDTGHFGWMVLLGLLSAFVVFTRVRSSKA